MDDKKTHDDSVANSPNHTGGEKARSRKKLVLAVLLVAGVAVLAGGAGAAWNWSRHRGTHPKKLDAVSQAAADAQKQVFSGNYDKAHQSINTALENPKLSAEAKQNLYMQEGSVYENQKKYDKAMESYRKAEALGETAGITQSIAFLAVKMDNKELAITYFRKTIPLLPKGDRMYDENKKYFENWVIHLEGGEPKS